MRVLAVLLSLHAAPPPPQAAQAAPLPSPAQALRDARSAQGAFERTRRAHLPVTHSPEGRCDVQVGRYCYWYDESEPPPPPEPERIAEARLALLDRLARLAAAAPHDGWIAGQRVRYLVEAGLPDSALAVARRCGAEAWGCEALAGFALHALRDYAAADRAYAAALARMPDPVRCEWNDLEPLLEAGHAEAFGRLGCTGRDSAAAEFFWLATPRAGGGGNDFRTEYFARRTYLATLDGAVTHHGSRFSADLGEMILRYGWATAWSRRPPTALGAGSPGVVGHEPRPAYAFLPEVGPGGRPVWDLRRPAPRARYAPAGVTALVPMAEVTVSRFERGAGALLVVAFAVPPDTLLREPEVVAVFSAGPSETASVARGGAPGGSGALVVRAPLGRPGWLAVEARDAETSAGAWHRAFVTLDAREGARLSSLLLFVPGAGLPESVEEAAESALAGAVIPLDGRIGLFWEMYGVPESGPLDVAVSVEEAGPGFFTRLGRALGLGRRPPPIRLEWEGTAPDGESVARAIELDLGRVKPGRYRVLVEARWAGGTARAAREIAVPAPR